MAELILSFGAQQQLEIGCRRYCRIYFYPVDDSIRVVQKTIPNSGRIGGTFIGKQRIPKMAETQDYSSHISLKDIQIGNDVNLYGRLYKITSCDAATRRYLVARGFRPMADLQEIEEQIREFPDLTHDGKSKRRQLVEKKHPLATFLKHSGQVLRYFGEWTDDSSLLGGVVTAVTEKVELRYYLEDNTCEVRLHSFTPAEAARFATCNPVPLKLLKRGPVLKDPSLASTITNLGGFGPPTLNLVGLKGCKIHVKDSCPRAASSPVFIGAVDLILGNVIQIAGRKLRLCECDQFTTQFYKEMFGIDQQQVNFLHHGRKLLELQRMETTTPMDPRKLEEHPRDPRHPLPTTVNTVTKHALQIKYK